jgi:hypothetical protein
MMTAEIAVKPVGSPLSPGCSDWDNRIGFIACRHLFAHDLTRKPGPAFRDHAARFDSHHYGTGRIEEKRTIA